MTHTDLFAPVATERVAADGYVLCEFGKVTLAIAQSDVLTIEHGGELAAPLPGEAPLGWFESAQGPWPVYGLNDELGILDRLPADRAFLAFLKTESTPIGLLCERVKILGLRSELRAEPLPEVMRDDRQPIRAIARLDAQRLALVMAEGLLATHIAELTKRTPLGAWQ